MRMVSRTGNRAFVALIKIYSNVFSYSLAAAYIFRVRVATLNTESHRN